MGRLQDLIAERTAIQAQIDLYLSLPEDTYPLGTVMLLSASSGPKWYIRKINEEAWVKIAGTGNTKELADWVLEGINSGVGYFELYRLITEELPIYTHDLA